MPAVPHRPYAATYLYDGIIHSTTLADHFHHLSEVLGSLWKATLMANT